MRVAFQILSLVGMLVLGIYLGIDTAEKNMHQIQGTEGAPRAIQITPQDGKIEIAVLGEVVETKNPVSKVNPVQVQEVKNEVRNGTNYLAVFTNQVGTGIREVTRHWVDWIFGWIDR